jgi:hypothetical protein
MSFKFTVRFAGVSAFVPNRDFDDKPTKICVLMPNGGDPYKGRDTTFAIDGNTPMRRHFPLLKFGLSQTVGAQSLAGLAEGVWYLNRQRITFELEPAPADPQAALEVRYSSEWDSLQTFPNPPTHEWKHLTEERKKELCWLPDLRRIVGSDLAHPDPNLLRPHRPGDKVGTQVILDRGVLTTLERDEMPWSLDTLDRRAYSRPLATLLALEIEGVNRVAVVATPLDADPGSDAARPTKLEFLPAADGSELTVDLITACEANPLNWLRSQEAEEKELRDLDFLWHYEVLTDAAREKIQRHLASKQSSGPALSLFPHRSNPEGGQGQNNNCVGSRPAPYPDLS